MFDDIELVPFGELLGLARDDGLVALESHVVQTPSSANAHAAVVEATARGNSVVFTTVGEANLASAPEEWHGFLTTLADIRAKSRALRELTGLEHRVQEELLVPYGSLSMPDLSSSPRTPVSNSSTPPRQLHSLDDQNVDLGDDDMPSAPSESAESNPPYEGLAPDMLARLRMLTTSLSALDDIELTDDEADERLNTFFVRAFKHPMSESSRVEGQRVVQRLSGVLSQRRSEATSSDS